MTMLVSESAKLFNLLQTILVSAGDVLAVRLQASIPRILAWYYWSKMSEMSGRMHRYTPLMRNVKIWNVRLLPPPVGMQTKMLLFSRPHLMIAFWLFLNSFIFGNLLRIQYSLQSSPLLRFYHSLLLAVLQLHLLGSKFLMTWSILTLFAISSLFISFHLELKACFFYLIGLIGLEVTLAYQKHSNFYDALLPLQEYSDILNVDSLSLIILC